MDFDQLITLIKAVSDSNLTGMKYEEKGVKISLTKDIVQVQAQGELPAAMPVQTVLSAPEKAMEKAPEETVMEAADEAKQKEGNILSSPLVGTFYAAPSEEAEPFVKVGDAVKTGQVLAIVEAMKLMNDIECECDGTVAEIYVQNGEAVEYGQPLFRIV